MVEAILRYLMFVIEDGDELNDWITHVPEWMQPILILIGTIIQAILGN